MTWESRCAECGKEMPAGRMQKCTNGGDCSWHIPAAARQSMNEMYEAIKFTLEKYSALDQTAAGDMLSAAIAKAEGKQP